MKLTRHFVEKPWGRSDIPGHFGLPAGHSCEQKIGEIWFQQEQGAQHDLLVKYIFTSERLSIQVHPSDQQAQAAGHPHGKEECWYILDAKPGAELGIGTTQMLDGCALQKAALDGTLEHLMDWIPAKKGQFFYIPAGTVHAIGAGVTLVEVQQNIDLTYRIFDYGRDRELHLDDGIAVANARQYNPTLWREIDPEGCEIMVQGAYFSLARCEGIVPEQVYRLFADKSAKQPFHIAPLNGAIKLDGEILAAGECGTGADLNSIECAPHIQFLVAAAA